MKNKNKKSITKKGISDRIYKIDTMFNLWL
jgi:hypothetical protein